MRGVEVELIFLAIGIVILLMALPQGAVAAISGTGNLNAAQIATYAQNAGFEGQDLQTAVAIALAESSGNPNANGDTLLTPGGSVGLWQINLAAHPEFSEWNLTDPQTNARAAYSIYAAAGFNFSPWSTYRSGAYQSYLSDAQNAMVTA